MDAERISALKIYVDELLEETAALLTIFSGRLYTMSYYLSLLEEESAARPDSCEPWISTGSTASSPTFAASRKRSTPAPYPNGP